MPDRLEAISAVARPGFNALLEDVFGLNVRGLRTLRDLYVHPRRVFDSARVIDWANQHTPTIRLTFSLITVYMLLSFFWAADDGPLYQSLFAQLEQAVIQNPDLPPAEDMIEGWFAAYSFSFPFVYMFVHFIAGSLLFVWGKGTSWTTRLRLYFGLLAVSMSLSLAVTLLMPFLTVDQLLFYSLSSSLLSIVAYAVTYGRGMAGIHSGVALWWRAPLVALFIGVTDILIAVMTSIGSGFWMQRAIGLG